MPEKPGKSIAPAKPVVYASRAFAAVRAAERKGMARPVASRGFAME